MPQGNSCKRFQQSKRMADIDCGSFFLCPLMARAVYLWYWQHLQAYLWCQSVNAIMKANALVAELPIQIKWMEEVFEPGQDQLVGSPGKGRNKCTSPRMPAYILHLQANPIFKKKGGTIPGSLLHFAAAVLLIQLAGRRAGYHISKSRSHGQALLTSSVPCPGGGKIETAGGQAPWYRECQAPW